VAAEDLDVRDDRELHNHRDEEQSCGLRRVRGHQGAFGVRLRVMSAVTASSEEKSTNGVICTCL
jgi:hypothetical protein